MKTAEDWLEELFGTSNWVIADSVTIRAIQLDAMAHCAWVAKCCGEVKLMAPLIYPSNHAIHKAMKLVDRNEADRLIQAEPGECTREDQEKVRKELGI
jgi:hypothetical protein